MTKSRSYVQTTERVRVAIRVCAAKSGLMQREYLDEMAKSKALIDMFVETYREVGNVSTKGEGK